VGETSLLTRAALTVAAQAHDLLLAQEGAFGTHLLAADVCEEPLMFGAGGQLALRDPAAPGLGIAVRSPRTFLETF
jgi:L-Ala-D/L-Glu epimerase